MFPVATEKHSSPWGFDHFVFIFKFYVFSQSVNVSVDRGSTGHYSLTRMSVRYLMACHVLLGTLTLCYVPTKFCYVYQVLSRFSMVNGDDGLCLSPFVPTVVKGGT